MTRLTITLKSARVNKNLSLKEAAELIGISVATIANYEMGKRFPDIPIIKKIEEVYGINYNEINFLLKNNG